MKQIDIGMEDFTHTMERKPKNKAELERFIHLCEKGLEAQIDWEMIYNCAKEELENESGN